MPIIFWSVAALDAALFLVLLLGFLKQGASSSGGREMGLFFAVFLPSVGLVAAALLFIFSRSDFWRFTALFIVAGPGLLIGGSKLRNAYYDYRSWQNHLGRGYFSGRAMRAMGAAVVQGDLEAMRRLAPQIDVNTITQPSKFPGMTLMRLAAEKAFNEDSNQSTPQDLAVVQTLLQLGAKPNPGLDAALRIKDAKILQVLLEGGADPNVVYRDQPVVFSWLGVLSLETVRLLAKHGLNLNVSYNHSPLVVEALFADRWDIVSLLIDLGVDVQKSDSSGRNVTQEAEKRWIEASREGRATDPFVLEVQGKLRRRAGAAK